jgi:hypothetical protein
MKRIVPVAIGGIAGFVFACLTGYHIGSTTVLGRVAQMVAMPASVAAYLTTGLFSLDVKTSVVYAIFHFLYWIGIGMLAGFLIGRSCSACKSEDSRRRHA